MSRHSTAASGRLLDGPPSKAAHEMSPVFRRGMHVIVCLEVCGERLERLAERAILRRRQVACRRPVGDAADREPGGPLTDDCGAGGDGKIAVAAADFPEC